MVTFSTSLLKKLKDIGALLLLGKYVCSCSVRGRQREREEATEHQDWCRVRIFYGHEVMISFMDK